MQGLQGVRTLYRLRIQGVSDVEDAHCRVYRQNIQGEEDVEDPGNAKCRVCRMHGMQNVE